MIKWMRRKQVRRSRRELNASTAENRSTEDLWAGRNRLFSCITFLDHLFILSPQFFNTCVEISSCVEIIETLCNRCKESCRILTRICLFSENAMESHYLCASLLLVLKFGSIENYTNLIGRVHYYINDSQFVYKKVFNLILQKGTNCYHMSNTNTRTQWDAVIPLNICAYNYNQNDIVPVSKIIKLQVDEEGRLKYQEAVHGILLMVDAFLNVYKKNVFMNTIEEPATSYFDRVGDNKDMTFLRFRSLQKYLYLINKNNWFGLQMPISLLTNKKLTHEDCVDILAGLPHDAWDLFKDETNLLRDGEFLRDSEKTSILESDIKENDRSFCEVTASMRDPRFLLHVNRFAYFFRKEVLVEKMFKVMNKYDRFQQYCNDLYPLFKKGHGFHEKSIHEFLYNSGLEDLNIDKAAHFFWFCGVIQERDAQITWNTHGPEKLESKPVQDSEKYPEMCKGINYTSVDHNQESAAFNLKQQISVLRKKKIQLSKFAKAG